MQVEIFGDETPGAVFEGTYIVLPAKPFGPYEEGDLKPWLGKWMQDNIALETAQFSLEGWMTIDKGDVTGGDVWLKQGGASWLGEKQTHTLSVDNLTAHIIHLPRLNWRSKVSKGSLICLFHVG